MALPSNTDLATLDIAYLGQPFVQVEAKNLDTETLDVAYLGQPFVGAPAAAAGVYSIAADRGIFALTGNAATLTEAGGLNNYNLPVDAGTFALTGNAATLRHNPTIIGATGTFALSGQQYFS